MNWFKERALLRAARRLQELHALGSIDTRTWNERRAEREQQLQRQAKEQQPVRNSRRRRAA
jgi:aminoglycoside phosphotransferase (APT) family kinase protein